MRKHPSRRGVLGAAALLPLTAVPAVAAIRPLRSLPPHLAGAPAAPPAPWVNPDADLVRLCDQHILNLHAYNTATNDLDPEDDPLWTAYERTRDAIDATQSQTLFGVLAKARAAKAEARNRDGTETPEGCPAAGWAWDIVNDLMQIVGEAPT